MDVDGVEFFGFDAKRIYMGEPIGDWTGDVTFSASSYEQGERADDVLVTFNMMPVYSARLQQALRDAGVDEIQFLPCRVVNGIGMVLPGYAIANLLQVRSAYCPKHSKVLYVDPTRQPVFVSGNIKVPLRDALIAEELKGCDVFRLREFRLCAFVSERFRKAYISIRATGISFREVQVITKEAAKEESLETNPRGHDLTKSRPKPVKSRGGPARKPTSSPQDDPELNRDNTVKSHGGAQQQLGTATPPRPDNTASVQEAVHDRLGCALKAGDLDLCHKIVAQRLSTLPASPFHIALDLAITNNPADVAKHFDGFFKQEGKRFGIGAAYAEMNGFDINSGRWFFDVFAFEEFGGHDDYEWLAEWQSGDYPSMTIKGLEELQAVYASEAFREPRFRDVANAAGLLVVIKFQDLIRRAAPQMRQLRFPLLATAHDYDLVYEAVPRR